MKVADRSGHGLLALAAGLAALITGVVDDSAAWFGASAVLLAIWVVFCIFAISPSVFTRSIERLEEKYKPTSPPCSLETAIPVIPLGDGGSRKDTMFGMQVLPSAVHGAIPVDWSDVPKAEANTGTEETSSVKKETHELVAALGC